MFSSSSSSKLDTCRMLLACSSKLGNLSRHEPHVWIDIGDGSSSILHLMSHFIDLSTFTTIFLLNAFPSSSTPPPPPPPSNLTCTNIQTLHFTLPPSFTNSPPASLITFSFSLSRIKDFIPCIDVALAHLAEDGLVGVADFFSSAKYDHPNRQQSFLKRWLWRAAFESFGFEIGPERRQYLQHRLQSAFEYNGYESIIPSLPFLKAPVYVWIGYNANKYTKRDWKRFPARASDGYEAKRPPKFPTTFLYSLSWEDPRVDEQALQINPNDTVLTLTSGGCNALDLVHQGAGLVVSVDINPAQSYLLELKRVAIMRLSFDDVWLMFGEGVHPKFETIFQREIAPFLSQGALKFWSKRTHYFKDGFYYQGGMGRLIKAIKCLAKLLNQDHWIDSLVNAPSLEKQKELWFSTVGKFLLQPNTAKRLLAYLVTNRLVLWFCAGVCKAQLKLIEKEDNIYNYIVRCLNLTAQCSHLRDSNYFYRCCLTGKFAPQCCPRFLEKDCFYQLKDDLAREERLLIRTGSFVDELRKIKYSKVILMDHVDWLEQKDIDILCASLRDQVKIGGRVILRSASRNPEYVKQIQNAGFQVVRLSTNEVYMDRVNMYASFYMAIRSNGS